ncbi:hypothetical protein [Kitasatospora sp. MAP5-34]|uniref:hypothetical protein n=1 Tax=Kitasatospora sp. MAP5-34 TaxID=3035102 RepID=UPI0024750CE1|nr:hypothetical protein [Kitasatospora sp. MAP5-34]MDH6576675.1 hypothetical protein [Kitasatospora sp. MAP5-34]
MTDHAPTDRFDRFDRSDRSRPDDALPSGRLNAFWDGDFTLGPASNGPASDSPAPGGSAIASLGGSGIRVGGRDLATLLAPVYRRLTGEPTD